MSIPETVRRCERVRKDAGNNGRGGGENFGRCGMTEITNVAQLPRGEYKIRTLSTTTKPIKGAYFIRWKHGGMVFVPFLAPKQHENG